jgi:hypothetical protein
MNQTSFNEWFSDWLLPNIPANSYIVMDNAKYHNAVTEKIPTASVKKSVMQEWLTSRGVEYETKMTKKQLFILIQQQNATATYVNDELAKSQGHQLIRLPPYHCELNPIEMVWSQVKGYVARQNSEFKISEVEKLLQEGVKEVTPVNWAKCDQRVQRTEQRMRDIEGLFCPSAEQIEPVRFRVTTEDSDEDSSD